MREKDSARLVLLRIVDDAEQRAQRATDGIVRCVAGGAPWAGERTLRYRGALSRARDDLDVALAALAAIDQLDAECGGAS